MKTFNGEVLFLDRSNINTDEIIPARYLTENSKEALKPYLLEDLTLDGFDPSHIKGVSAIVTRANFGCGSSREHAPWALEANGINIVIAESFARIFRQNMYNCGMIAAELPAVPLDALFREFAGEKTMLAVDTEKAVLTFTAAAKQKTVPFALQGFEKALVESGGWVEYAARTY
ncbi:MAG: 3-isopropylmalate dehydratase small subunit [Treponema sp.]|jgi:3-isopropylmalate/(R)-2-methylmalate dehydratase small subunit|nr:3-isopropylmalate dehydratase small subunit [Treponema sp.]